MLTTRLYVVLDAKNHFVSSAHRAFFVSPDGKPRVNRYSYVSHPLRTDLSRVLTYCGIDGDRYLDRFSATVTPFVLDRAAVVRMMSDIESLSGSGFAVEFEKQRLLEFFLYSAWLLRNGVALDDAFDFHQMFSPTVWPKGVDAQTLEHAFEQARSGASPIFSIHRRALGRLPVDETGGLEEFWASIGLFADSSAAHAFVRDFKTSFFRSEVVRKMRETRGRALISLGRHLRALAVRLHLRTAGADTTSERR